LRLALGWRNVCFFYFRDSRSFVCFLLANVEIRQDELACTRRDASAKGAIPGADL
jgi:hypothetical protein